MLPIGCSQFSWNEAADQRADLLDVDQGRVWGTLDQGAGSSSFADSEGPIDPDDHQTTLAVDAIKVSSLTVELIPGVLLTEEAEEAQ